MSPILIRWLPGCVVSFVSTILIAKVWQVQNGASLEQLQHYFPDLLRYFESSAWVVGHGVLYKDIFSEYPLLANLLFAGVRWINHLFGDSFIGFSVLWIAFAALCTGTMCTMAFRFIAANFPTINLWVTTFAWLTPGILHFALLRYDIYPALATLCMMIFLYRKSYLIAAFWISIAIALKGYPVFLLPAILVYVHGQTGYRSAWQFLLIALATPLMSLLLVITFSGIDGLLSPFLFHGGRDFNPDSTYTVLCYLFNSPLHSADLSPLPMILQGLCVLVSVILRPKNFNELVLALTLTIVGVINFSVFYSPQFAIWLLPIAGLSFNRCIQYLLLAYGLWTGGYFILEYFRNLECLLTLVAGLVALRLALMFVGFRSLQRLKSF